MVMQNKKLSRAMLLFGEKILFSANLSIFAFTSFFSEVQCFENLKLKYSLFQSNHAFSLQHSDAEQKVESGNAFVW